MTPGRRIPRYRISDSIMPRTGKPHGPEQGAVDGRFSDAADVREEAHGLRLAIETHIGNLIGLPFLSLSAISLESGRNTPPASRPTPVATTTSGTKAKIAVAAPRT